MTIMLYHKISDDRITKQYDPLFHYIFIAASWTPYWTPFRTVVSSYMTCPVTRFCCKLFLFVGYTSLIHLSSENCEGKFKR